MRTINHVTLVGRLGRDPEVHTAPNRTAWGTLSLATHRARKQGETWVEEVDWHQVKVFGQEAEYAARYFTKGALVSVEGSVRYEKWQDKQENPHWSTRILADRVSLLSAGRPNDAGSNRDDVPADADTVVVDADQAPLLVHG